MGALFRLVEDDDYAGVIKLIDEFYEESIREYGSTLDLNFMIEMFGKLKSTSFLAEEDGKIIGLLAGQLVKDLLSNEDTYAEVMWFVTKKKRKCGIELLSFVENRVRASGIKRMIMGHLFNQKVGKLQKYYSRLGYKPMEIHYIKEL